MKTLARDRNIVPWSKPYTEVHKEALHGNIVINSGFFESESSHLIELLKHVLDKEEFMPLDKGEETNILKDEFGVALEPLNLNIYTLLCITYAIGITLHRFGFLCDWVQGHPIGNAQRNRL